jgi:hypothetical protein
MRTSIADLALLRFSRGGDYARPASCGSDTSSHWAKLSFFGLAFTILSLADARADTTNLTPIADTSLFQLDPNNNLGGLTSIPAGTIRTGQRSRALFKFDLTQIPSSATITSADLTVQVVIVPPAGALTASTFDLHRVLRDWGEGTGAGPLRGSPATTNEATWNNRFHPSTPWAQPGGSSNVDFVGVPSGTSFISGIGPYTFSSTPGLVADVQAWLSNPATNFGWMLITESERTPESARRFASREDPNRSPMLVIGYVLGPTIVTQPQSQTVPVDATVVFSVTASGTPPITYQWQSNGVPISGATSNVLVLSKVQTNAAGQYGVLVTDQNGSTPSQPATLIVIPPGLPFVSIIDPTNESRFPSGSQVLVTAVAGETNGSIAQVEFFLNTTNSVGVTLTNPDTNIYTTLLTNVAAGSYSLSAVATDPRQVAVTSSIVNITFVAPPTVTVTVLPPGTNFLLGTTLTNAAQVTEGVTNVDFFDGAVLLTNVSTLPFAFAWTPTVPRLYSLSARATDDLGQSGTSPPFVIRVHGPDSVPPRIAITNAPPNFARVTNSTVIMAGTASDANLDHVEYQVTSGPFLDQPAPAVYANGTSNWMAIVTLQPGPNQVRLRSFDFSTNSSPTLSRFYTYFVPATLVVQTNGAGTVTPDLNGKVLQVGQVYNLSARPLNGWIFDYWEGFPHPIQTPALSFAMETNLTNIVAHFILNPFVPGPYAGVFYDTNAPVPEGSGTLNLQLATSGSFSASLGMNGTRYPFTGKFDSSGQTTVPVLRQGLTPGVVALQLDITRGTGQLFGLVTNTSGTNLFVSQLFAERNSFDARTNPAPQAGVRSFILNSLPDRTFIGSGQASISASGSVRIQGRWSNNNTFSLASTLFQTGYSGGNVPFYLSYFGGTEIVIGLPNFRAHPDDITGVLEWVRSGTNQFSKQLEFAPSP